MFPLEKQVASLDLCKKLKELNCKQESAFYWCNHKKGFEKDGLLFCEQTAAWSRWKVVKDSGVVVYYAAFTVAELGDFLKDIDEPLPSYWPDDKKWMTYDNMIEADTEADVRALMMIYLLENGIVKP